MDTFLINMIPVLSGSLDSTLKMADFVFYILCPASIIIPIIIKLFGKEDQ